MKITKIALDDGRPDEVTAVLTLDELIYIGLTIGKHAPTDANARMPEGNRVVTEIWNCLTGELFNRYWDDGINGAARGDDE